MHNVTKQIEIVIWTANESASLGKLMATAASCGAEVLAASSYCDHAGTVVKLVTDAAERTTRALEAADFRCTTTPVVLVEAPDKPGLAARLGKKLADADIGVLYSYTFLSENNRSYVVFKTTDDDCAVCLLDEDTLIHNPAAARNWREERTDRQHQEATSAA